mmetsp:Transcript_5317/g.13392  ORF Transcript_5317/g.13392 Transcript_5317/m.13392 type:complete len:91 (+) Transcript_5317:755-1027(+)
MIRISRSPLTLRLELEEEDEEDEEVEACWEELNSSQEKERNEGIAAGGSSWVGFDSPPSAMDGDSNDKEDSADSIESFVRDYRDVRRVGG